MNGNSKVDQGDHLGVYLDAGGNHLLHLPRSGVGVVLELVQGHSSGEAWRKG